MENLSDKIALKIDDELIFGKEDSSKFIKENQNLFANLNLEFFDSKITAYGYNKYQHLVKITYNRDLIEKIIIITDKPSYKRYKAIVSYDGSNFSGFQFQSNQRTIQGEISKVINKINNDDQLIQGASRTDALVHAENQVIHFDSVLDISIKKWQEILNHQLPKDIYIKDIKNTHPLFHSRYDVYKKKYIYKIHTGEYNPLLANYYLFENNLDLEILKQQIKQLVGTHDFASFSKGEISDSIRTIFSTSVTKHKDVIYLEFVGNGFLRYMVRLIVDYLIKLSQSKTSLSIKEVLKTKNRKYTNNIAIANGLYLEEIYY
ncbi:MAG: tRNA pseudouridine(38-40) synthase TruA [Candidatus Izimaplasma sp.]|nr:tRNA pseudouridine(38-40) synthase TruA [Candidatus Izimaplasma bacterium]